MTTVLLVDDQAMIRAGLRSVLESADIEIVGEASDGAAALTLLRTTRPDIVLMDLRMPGVDGVETTRRIRTDADLAKLPVLVLTTFDADANVLAALRAGADGFLSKSAEPEELIAAVLSTAAGHASLSPAASRAVVSHLGSTEAPSPADPDLAARVQTLTARERDLVLAAAAGEDNATIAKRLFISPLTVKTHLNRAMVKLDARDRGQLVSIAYRSGMVK